MQLREARLCLDCEELHTEEQCPVCASEAFAFVTRWLPVDERRARNRRRAQPSNSGSRTSQWLTGATAGVAIVTAARWLLRGSPTPAKQTPATRRTDFRKQEPE